MSNSLKEAFQNLASSLGHCQENSRSIVDVLKRGCTDLANNSEGGGGGGSSQDYSTTEHVVGKWIDGTSIYSKTVYLENITITANSDLNLNISDYFTNVEKILDFECFYSGGVLPAIMPNTSLNPYSTGISFDIPSNHIIFGRGSGSNATISVYLTLKYIKTA